MDASFAAEIAFLSRKLPTVKIKWEVLTALSQLVSTPLSDAEAQHVIKYYKDILGRKAGTRFNKMIFAVSSKLRGGTRVAVSILVLREIFSDEIDNDWGGGGRGYNPLQTRPSRGTGGI